LPNPTLRKLCLASRFLSVIHTDVYDGQAVVPKYETSGDDHYKPEKTLELQRRNQK
jgi:hypothetical protein